MENLEYSNLIRSLAETKSMEVQDRIILAARSRVNRHLTREQAWFLHAVYTSPLLDERWWRCAVFLGDTDKAEQIMAFHASRGRAPFDPKPYRTPGHLLYDLFRDVGDGGPAHWSKLDKPSRDRWERIAIGYHMLESLWGGEQ